MSRMPGPRAVRDTLAAAGVLVALLTCVWGDCAVAAPNAESSLDQQVKAAFLYNFAKFVQWPGENREAAGTPVILGVVGSDPLYTALAETVRGKSVNGRSLEVRRLWVGPELKSCHILFVGSSEKARLEEILAAVGNAGVLTVGDMDRFAERGGMIHFLTDANRIRLEINIDAVNRSGLKISSKLLQLATFVADGSQAKGR